jgi:hypothetical protein
MPPNLPPKTPTLDEKMDVVARAMRDLIAALEAQGASRAEFSRAVARKLASLQDGQAELSGMILAVVSELQRRGILPAKLSSPEGADGEIATMRIAPIHLTRAALGRFWLWIRVPVLAALTALLTWLYSQLGIKRP